MWEWCCMAGTTERWRRVFAPPSVCASEWWWVTCLLLTHGVESKLCALLVLLRTIPSSTDVQGHMGTASAAAFSAKCCAHCIALVHGERYYVEVQQWLQHLTSSLLSCGAQGSDSRRDGSGRPAGRRQTARRALPSPPWRDLTSLEGSEEFSFESIRALLRGKSFSAFAKRGVSGGLWHGRFRPSRLRSMMLIAGAPSAPWSSTRGFTVSGNVKRTASRLQEPQRRAMLFALWRLMPSRTLSPLVASHAQVLISKIGALRVKICDYSSMQCCAAVGVSVSRVT